MMPFTMDDEDTWPRDSRFYVFLARAIDDLGKKVFGVQWTGKELSAKGETFRPLAGLSINAQGHERNHAHALVEKYGLSPLPLSPQERSDALAALAAFSNDERARFLAAREGEFWKRAQEASRLDCEARDRFLTVTREITDHCARGRLVAATRWDDGSFVEMHCDRWNNPKPWWFKRCEISAQEANWGGKGYLPIFIRQAELEKIVGSASDRAAKAGRKPKYAWADFNQELGRKLAYEGSIDPASDVSFTQSSLEGHMSRWCDLNWTETPGESTIRSYVAGFLRANNGGQ